MQILRNVYAKNTTIIMLIYANPANLLGPCLNAINALIIHSSITKPVLIACILMINSFALNAAAFITPKLCASLAAKSKRKFSVIFVLKILYGLKINALTVMKIQITHNALYVLTMDLLIISADNALHLLLFYNVILVINMFLQEDHALNVQVL